MSRSSRPGDKLSQLAQKQRAEGATSTTRPLRVLRLGMIGYRDCWELQKRIAQAVGQGSEPDTLLLLQHPHTFTCGRRGGRQHILINDAQLAAMSVEVVDADRGGDVTYHGPGQLVAYPLISLTRVHQQIDYPRYVRQLEETLISVLDDWNIGGQQLEGLSGVWLGGDPPSKVAAIGVKVDALGVTSHGIALNVTTDLSYFDMIVPCGIDDKGVTSLAQSLTCDILFADVEDSFVQHFAQKFGFSTEAHGEQP